MLVFSRQLLVAGDPRETLPWVRELAERASDTTGFEVSAWSALAGAPVGTTALTSVVESRARLSAGLHALAEDGNLHDIESRGRNFLAAPPENLLREIVHLTDIDGRPGGVGSVVSSHSAQIATGKYVVARTWATEMADLVAEISGATVALCVNVAGKFGGVEWIQPAPDIETQESWDEKVSTDERYMAKLSESGGMFVEGSANRVIGQRIA